MSVVNLNDNQGDNKMTKTYSDAELMEIKEGRRFEDGALVHDDEGNGTVVSATQTLGEGSPLERTSDFWYYEVQYENGGFAVTRGLDLDEGWKNLDDDGWCISIANNGATL